MSEQERNPALVLRLSQAEVDVLFIAADDARAGWRSGLRYQEEKRRPGCDHDDRRIETGTRDLLTMDGIHEKLRVAYFQNKQTPTAENEWTTEKAS